MLAAFVCLIACGQLHAAGSGSDPQNQVSVDSLTASQVRYLHDQEKLAMDLNWDFQWMWEESIFQSLGAMERRHMDELLTWMSAHGLTPLVTSRSEGAYGDDDHLAAWEELLSRGSASLVEAYRANAYMEEWDITEIRALMESTNEQTLVIILERLLAGAEKHLRMLVSRIQGLGQVYQAQMLRQSDVNQICSGVEPYTGTQFALSGALNDAWFYPFTAGQGFFVSVYPDSKTVFVSWMSYDTDLPGGDAVSRVGDAGQRWLIAQGNYAGNRAELEIFSASGGVLDSVTPTPVLEFVGQMLLQFDDCSSGSVIYTLLPLFGGYIIPIERLAPDNVTQCQLNTQR
jgi:hypothetical protein